MSYRHAHDWHDGARINAFALATCRHCGCLRTTFRDGASTYTRRVELEDERVRTTSPPCVAPDRRKRRPQENAQQALAFARGLETGRHKHIPATPEQIAALRETLPEADGDDAPSDLDDPRRPSRVRRRRRP